MRARFKDHPNNSMVVTQAKATNARIASSILVICQPVRQHPCDSILFPRFSREGKAQPMHFHDHSVSYTFDDGQPKRTPAVYLAKDCRTTSRSRSPIIVQVNKARVNNRKNPVSQKRWIIFFIGAALSSYLSSENTQIRPACQRPGGRKSIHP